MNKFLKWINNLSFIIEIKDIINFFKFRYQMKKLEKTDIDFLNFNFKRNWLGNVIYFQVNCTDEELANYNYSPVDMVMNKIQKEINYFNDKGWGDYLIPEVINFVDDDNNKTLSYLILFMYTPIKFSFSKLVYRLFLMILLILGGYFGYIYLKTIL